MQVVGALGFVGLAFFGGHIAHALADQGHGFRVQCQRHAQGLGRALARVVVGGGAYAAKAEDHGLRCEGAAQGVGDARPVIAHVLGMGQGQATRAQQLDQLGKVLVGTLARQDFVSDDECAYLKGHEVFSCGVEGGEAAPAPSGASGA